MVKRHMSKYYDYIVIGSGAAGSVVSSRLAESFRSDQTICLLEAGGGDQHPFVRIPAGFVKNLGNPGKMWQFRSVAGSNTAQRQVYLPQGKLLGGSTSINGLIYNRGWSGDFDAWADAGNTGWAYQDVLPYFRKSETRSGVNSGGNNIDRQYRGEFGPLRISDPDEHNPVCDAFVDAAVEHGLPRHIDYNGASQRGAGYYQRFIFNGKRETVAGAYLKPALAKGNIDLRLRSLVTGLIVKEAKVIGVEIRRGGSVEQVYCRKEVILSAGTINTVRLLELSGIGNGEHLQKIGIPVVHHLPGVGENLQDHYFVRLSARLQPDSPSLNQQAKGLALSKEVIKWVLGRPSILALSPSVAFAFLNSVDPNALPDLQFVFSHGSYKPGRVYELDDFPAATCGFTQQRPESRGYVHLTSPDPTFEAEVQPNYLIAESDQQVAIRAMRIARSFLQADSMQRWVEEEVAPGKDCENDEQLLDYARNTGNTGYHLVGTCKMGPASHPMSVVGADLKMHGLDGLRIVDASVMPSVTSSNTCAATIMIGEKAADMIANEPY